MRTLCDSPEAEEMYRDGEVLVGLVHSTRFQVMLEISHKVHMNLKITNPCHTPMRAESYHSALIE